ncbi:hypothetical protein AAG906_018109 [Vitis piasezkii]
MYLMVHQPFGYWIGVLLISPHGDHIPRSVRLAFSDRHPATNNIVEYEACILGLETALELGIRQMEVFGDSNLVLRQIQGEWKTRDVKLRPYHAYLEFLVGRFDDLRYIHRLERRTACRCLSYSSFHDYHSPDDGLPWYHDIYHFLRLGVYPEATTAKDRRALRQLATRFRGSCESLRTTYGRTYVGSQIAASLFRDVPSVRYGDLIHVPPSELHALTSPWPFSVWGIDIIGKISPKSSSGHEFILVAIDYFTKWVEAPRATPYSLVYGMEAVLPVEIEIGSLRVALERDSRDGLGSRRLRAHHVRAYQRKMARAFKKRVKPRPLHVGAAWSMDLDGNQFSEPTNVDQLKRITCLMRDDLMPPIFPDLSHVRCHTGAYSVTCSMIDDSMLSDLRPIIHFDAIQGHISVRMRFTDHEGVACLSLFARCAWISRVIISVGYISDLLRVPSVLFSGYQDRSDTSDAILGHISLIYRVLGFGIESSITSRLGVRAIVITVFASSISALSRYHFSVLSHRHHRVFSSAFRAIIGFQIDIQSRVLEPSSSPCVQFGIQSHHRFSDRHSESRPRFERSISLLGRSIAGFGSTLSRVLGFGVESLSLLDLVLSHRHHRVFSSAFRAIIGFQIDIQSRVLGFGVQSRYHSSASVFRAIVITVCRFGIEPSSVSIDIPSRVLGLALSRYHSSPWC